MKLLITSPNQVPHGGGYYLNRPDLGIVGRGTVFKQLVESVRQYRIANSLPIGLGFEDQVETAVCNQYPQECSNMDGDRMPLRDLTYGDVIAGTKMLVQFKAQGSPLVSQEEAIRRARICSNCPANRPFKTPCNGICGVLAEVVNKAIGGATTSYDHLLRGCQICRCYLKPAVWVPLDIQQKPLSEEQKKQFIAMRSQSGCWKADGLDNPPETTN